jgi:5'-nucleotidase (lipoprotein e(P4) family)
MKRAKQVAALLLLVGGMMVSMGWPVEACAQGGSWFRRAKVAAPHASLALSATCSCSSVKSTSSPTESAPPQATLNLVKGLAQSLTLADAQALQQGYDQAIEAIAKVLPNNKVRPVVVLDLDETLIDNRAYFIQHGPYNEALWEQWVLTAQAPALPGAVDFVQFLEAHQVPYYFISGRREKWRTATEANLAALGMKGYRALLLKPNDYPKDKSPKAFKAGQRCGIEQQTGQPVFLLMGDQVSDLTGECAGQVQIKLPNRLYELP